MFLLLSQKRKKEKPNNNNIFHSVWFMTRISKFVYSIKSSRAAVVLMMLMERGKSAHPDEVIGLNLCGICDANFYFHFSYKCCAMFLMQHQQHQIPLECNLQFPLPHLCHWRAWQNLFLFFLNGATTNYFRLHDELLKEFSNVLSAGYLLNNKYLNSNEILLHTLLW